MSEQQVERLQALLDTVQKNRQRPAQVSADIAAGVVAKASPANTTSAGEPGRGRALPAAEPPPSPVAAQSSAAAPPTPRRDAPAAAPSAAAQAPSSTASAPAHQPLTPKVIEPDAPKEPTRPIAQLVSKHAPVVDATFGAMLKRSLSLRPH